MVQLDKFGREALVQLIAFNRDIAATVEIEIRALPEEWLIIRGRFEAITHKAQTIDRTGKQHRGIETTEFVIFDRIF